MFIKSDEKRSINRRLDDLEETYDAVVVSQQRLENRVYALDKRIEELTDLAKSLHQWVASFEKKGEDEN